MIHKYSKQEQTYSLQLPRFLLKKNQVCYGLGLFCLGSWYQGHSSRECSLSISYVKVEKLYLDPKIIYITRFIMGNKFSAFNLDVP